MRKWLINLFKRYGRFFEGLNRDYWDLWIFSYVESKQGKDDFHYFDLKI